MLVALDGLSDAAVWAEIQRRLSGAPPKAPGIKRAEIETLLTQRDSIGEDKPEGAAPLTKTPTPLLARREPRSGFPRPST